MDIFVLDEFLRRTEVIDRYESFIWTEREAAYGDFELVIRADRGIQNLLVVGTRLAILRSFRVMVVETLENSTDSDGNKTLTVTGRSLELILDDRVNQGDTIAAGTSVEYEELVGTPGDIARYFFDTFCRNNVDVPADNIPFLQPGSIFVPGSISEPDEIITFRYENDTVYNTIKKLCEVYDLGFRLVRNADSSELYFDVYTGHNRTSLQTVNSPVIFSEGLDNLSNTTQLTSTAQQKNVAYVFGLNGSRIVFADGVDPTVAGFERRVLVVNARDIELPVGPDLNAALDQKGKEELANHRVVLAFDGEVSQFTTYIYGVHYNLGDIVEKRAEDGTTTNMRVTEHIFLSDREGDRSYPTLSIDLLISPGTWLGWDGNQVWDDADGFWEDA